MRMWLTLICAAALLLGAGCAAEPDPVREPVGELQDRLESARTIENTAQRDQTIEEIALAPRTAITRALRSRRPGRLQTARSWTKPPRIARKMESIGNRVAAEQFVRLIRNPPLRDQLHMEFAS